MSVVGVSICYGWISPTCHGVSGDMTIVPCFYCEPHLLQNQAPTRGRQAYRWQASLLESGRLILLALRSEDEPPEPFIER